MESAPKEHKLDARRGTSQPYAIFLTQLSTLSKRISSKNVAAVPAVLRVPPILRRPAGALAFYVRIPRVSLVPRYTLGYDMSLLRS